MDSKSNANPANLETHDFQIGTTYQQNNPHQKRITKSLVEELIVGSAYSLSTVDSVRFRRFMKVAQSKWNPPSRKTITSKTIPQMATEREAKIKEDLKSVKYVSATVDIWSDRRMRGYLGITGHTIIDNGKQLQLRSHLLSCNRFQGSHTGQKIADSFEEVCEKFDIMSKLDYIITDNAANMRKAFTTCFPKEDEQDEEDTAAEMLDDPDIWSNIAEADMATVFETINRSGKKCRLQCFTHSLQLAVGDAMKDTKAASMVISKCSKLSSLLHTSGSLMEAYEAAFGSRVSIPADICTRWNSTYKQLSAVLKLGMPKQNEILHVHSPNLAFTAKDWSQLVELVTILHPFSQATDVTQGEKCVTSSYVLPCVLSLYRHTVLQVETSRYLKKMAATLRDSIRRRFSGIFQQVEVSESGSGNSSTAKDLPFGNDVYVMAAVLDPTFGFFWLEHSDLEEDAKDNVRISVRRKIVGQGNGAMTDNEDSVAAAANPAAPPTAAAEEPDTETEPGYRLPELFSYRHPPAKKARVADTQSVAGQYAEYLALVETRDASDALSFWFANKERFNLLYPIALRQLSIPASSSPIERVFSHGGVIFRPHRASMSDSTLSNLIFLKCNNVYDEQ